MPQITYNSRIITHNGRIILNIDPDTYNFIYAAGITNDVQIGAVNYLVTEMKRIGVWSKMKAIYPFVGGTAITHKYNLKDPRDLDAAFRLQFIGTITHSNTGALPNGSTGYADTFLTPSISLTTYDTHLSFYSRTNSLGNYVEIGSSSVTNANTSTALTIRYGDGILYSDHYGYNTNGRISVANPSSIGFYIGSRINQSNHSAYKNGTSIINSNIFQTSSLSTKKISIFAYNYNGIIANYSNRECAFASIGDGLTDLEAANFYSVVQQYQTLLNRAI